MPSSSNELTATKTWPRIHNSVPLDLLQMNSNKVETVSGFSGYSDLQTRLNRNESSGGSGIPGLLRLAECQNIKLKRSIRSLLYVWAIFVVAFLFPLSLTYGQEVPLPLLREMMDSGDSQQINIAIRGFEDLHRRARGANDKNGVLFAKWGIASCNHELGNDIQAKQQLQSIIAQFENSPPSAVMYFVYRDLGKWCQVDWQLNAALENLEKAMQIGEQLNELPKYETAGVRLSRAIALVVVGDNHQAETEFKNIAASLRKEDDHRSAIICADCEIQLAELDLRAANVPVAIGRLVSIRNKYKQNLSIRNKYKTYQVSDWIERIFSCHTLLAKLLRDVTRYTDAEAELSGARDLLDANVRVLSQNKLHRHYEELAIASAELKAEQAQAAYEYEASFEGIDKLLTQGELYSEKAQSWHQKLTKETTKETGSKHAVLAMIHSIRGMAHAKANKLQSAKSSFLLSKREYTAAIKVFEMLLENSNRDNVLELRHDRGRVLESLGEYSEAYSELRKVLEQYSERYGPESLQTAEVHQSLISLCLAKGDRSAALLHVQAHRKIANNQLHPYAGGLTPAAQRRFFRRWCEPGLHAGLAMAITDGELAGRATEWLANAKAKSVEVLAISNQQGLKGDQSSPIRRVIQEQAYLLYGPNVENKQSSLLELETEKRRLVGERSTSFSSPWRSLTDLQAALEAGEAFVDIFRLSPPGEADAYYAWVYTREGRPRVLRLGSVQSIEDYIDKLVSHMEGYPGPYDLASNSGVAEDERRLTDELLNPLSKRLLRPLWEAVGDHPRWIISPDGQLWNVPWACLLVPGTDEYAIEHLSLRYAISARDIFKRQSPVAKRGPPVVVAKPAYASRPNDVEGFWRKEGFQSLDDLGDKSYRLLKRSSTSNVILKSGQDATKSAVLDLTEPPDVLYMSTHGAFLKPTRLRVDDPFLCCYVALAGYDFIPKPNKQQNNLTGVLTGAEVLHSPLHDTGLVVLSACQSGRGIANYGHSAASLRHAFHLAGARCVVSSLWSVGSEPTDELMAMFMRTVTSGQNVDKAEALRMAQIQLIERLRNGYYESSEVPTHNLPAHPFLWAAFTVSGF